MNTEPTKEAETRESSGDIAEQAVASGGGTPVSQTAQAKKSAKQIVIHELREVLYMIVYLAISLSFVATFRSLVLIQQGVNVFSHSYVTALVLAVALGKIVVVAQRFRFISALNHRPLVQCVLYKSVILTAITDIGLKVEERVFPIHLSEPLAHPEAMWLTHQLALLSIFSVMFTYRDLDRVLGEGTMRRLFWHGPNHKVTAAQSEGHE